jgi:hypothetical protein
MVSKLASGAGHDPGRLPAFPLEDPPRPALPKRSTLYPLVPVGLGTPLIESLTSYIARLAGAHSMATTDLLTLALEAAPNEDFRWTGWKPVTPSLAFTIVEDRSESLDDIGPEAYCAMSGLSRLTTVDSLCYLTMIPLRALVQLDLKVGNRAAWCPACFQAWRDYGISLYEPLLWKLQIATVCPIHRQRLVQICSKCGTSATKLVPLRLVGYCDNCGAWLGASSDGEADDGLDRPVRQRWDRYIADEVGRLLASMSRGPVQLHPGTLGDNPAQGADSLRNWDWGPHLRSLGEGIEEKAREGEGQTLDALLRACAILNIHLPGLLLGASLASTMGDSMLLSYLVSLRVMELSCWASGASFPGTAAEAVGRHVALPVLASPRTPRSVASRKEQRGCSTTPCSGVGHSASAHSPECGGNDPLKFK